MNRNYFALSANRVLVKLSSIFFDYINKKWIILGSTNSSGILSIYHATEAITGALVNLLGGVISDLYSPKTIIILADVFSSIACFIASFYVNSNAFFFVIIIGNILLEAFASFSSSPRKVVVKFLFRSKQEISTANSIVTTASELTKMLSPVVALFFSQELGLKYSLRLCACLYILAAMMLLLCRFPVKAAKKETYFTFKNLYNELIDGLNYLLSDRNILFVVGVSSVVNFMLTGYNLVIPYAEINFQRFNSDCYAWILACEAIGGVVGAVAAGKTYWRNQTQMTSLIGVGVSLISAPIVYFCGFPLFFCMLPYFLFGAFLSIYNVKYITYLQINVEERYIGRVFGITFLISSLLVPIASFFFAVINPNGMQEILFFVGGSIFAIAVIVLFILKIDMVN